MSSEPRLTSGELVNTLIAVEGRVTQLLIADTTNQDVLHEILRDVDGLLDGIVVSGPAFDGGDTTIN